MPLTKASYSMITGAPFNVLDYGADPTGLTNSRAACQSAIDAAQAVGGGIVLFPEGTYLLTGVASDDTVLNGLLIPYTSADSSSNRVILQGQGRSTILKANSNDMYIVRFSDCHGGVRDLTLDGNSKTGVIGLGCVPESTTQTSDYVFQNYNIFSGLYIRGCVEGFTLKCGPDVGGGDSGCWYNILQNTSIFSCTRGIWLQDGPNAGCSGANRNVFMNVRIGQNCNTGVQIDSADTCKFYGVNFEGITSGTSPNTIPTAVFIEETGALSGLDNNYNEFIGCTFEACTRDLDNYNGRSQFVGCNFAAGKVHTSGGAGYGLLCIGGDDASQTPQVTAGLVYQLGGQIPGLNNGHTFATLTGTASVGTDATITSSLSFQETSGISGSVANGATFTITIPAPRRPQLLFLYSDYNLNQPGVYLVCGDGSTTITSANIAASAGLSVAGTAAATITVTNNFGGSAAIRWTLTPFGVAY